MATRNDDADDAPVSPQVMQMLATMDPQSMFPDIAEAYLSGEMTQEAAANEIVGRLTRLTAPRPIPDDWRVETDECVALHFKWLPDQDHANADIPQDVLDALNTVLSGPNATPAQRANSCSTRHHARDQYSGWSMLTKASQAVM